MRLNLANDSIESQIAELQLFLDESKTPQLTSQDSGLLAHTARAAVRNQYGDVVKFETDSGTVTTSQIALPATPSSFQLNTIYATQIFVPKHNKPAVAVPLLKLKVDSNGLHGESELFVSAQWGITMAIYNAANVQVGTLGINQSFGNLFERIYHPTQEYVWETAMFYECSVPFVLSYEFTVRSSDDGYTSSELEGLF